jgi:hypothetical protein
MADILVPQTIFAAPITLLGVLAVCLGALYYFRRVSLERPPIGVFNGRDIIVLYFFIITLPLLYLVLPQWLLTGFLIVTFMAALSIGYRPVLPRAVLWPAIGLLLGVNIWLARTMLGSVAGWQLMLSMNALMVMLAAVGVANLYVQGGMRLKHVAVFALTLGVYDLAFLPFTLRLADGFIGHPLNPAVGMRMSVFNVDIGLGDLLVYGLFATATLKAYGPRAARVAVGVMAVFGAILPVLAPLIITEVTRGTGNVVTPAQLIFGPAAFITYLLLRRHYGPERTFAQFRADPSGAPVRRQAAQPVQPAAQPVPAAAPSLTEAVPGQPSPAETVPSP